MEKVPSGKNQDTKLQERIRLLAYEIYMQRGRADGKALDDWLQAEEELIHGSSRHWAWRHDVEKNPPAPKR